MVVINGVEYPGAWIEDEESGEFCILNDGFSHCLLDEYDCTFVGTAMSKSGDEYEIWRLPEGVEFENE